MKYNYYVKLKTKISFQTRVFQLSFDVLLKRVRTLNDVDIIVNNNI